MRWSDGLQRGVDGDVGMWDGEAGNDKSRNEAALRLWRGEERDSVVNLDAMAGGGYEK